jgi:hypothetical protein
MLLPVKRIDTFYTNTIVRKKSEKMTSLPVPSLQVTWLLVMSHPLAMLLPVMRNGTFRTTTMVRKKSAGMHFRACAEHTSGYDVTSGHMTSCNVISGQGRFRWRHFQKRIPNGPLPFAPPEICIELPRYTTLIFGLGGPINNPWKNIEGRHSSFPLGV